MTTVQSRRAAAAGNSTRDPTGWVLRINGGFLVLAGLVALMADLGGYFFAAGPFASLAGEPTAIASVEAHGLGALAGLLIWRGAAMGQRWGRHALALLVHLFLCLCNLLFWQVYVEMQILAVGVVSTTAHAVFVAVHLACLARAGQGAEPPVWVASLRRAGLYVRAAAIGTLLSGVGVHLLIVVLGRGALPGILTPPVELLLTAPMFYVSVAGWLAWPRLRFRGRWHQVAVAIILIYFPLGLPLHLLTITTGSTTHYASIPPWYSLVIVPVMAAFISCLAALRLSGETG